MVYVSASSLVSKNWPKKQRNDKNHSKEIDAEKGTISVNLSEDEIKKRKSEWKPKESNFESGTLWKYAQSVGEATNGAVTHPGAFKEKKTYADI